MYQTNKNKVDLTFNVFFSWLANGPTHLTILFIIYLCCCGKCEDGFSSLSLEKDTVLSSDLIIAEGSVLTIKSGVKVLVRGYRRIIVKGLIVAVGTSDKPILFTCEGRPRCAVESPCWDGISIVGKKAQGVFSHCLFEGAYKNLIWEASPVFDSCKFCGNHFALYSTRAATPHIKNSKFYRNIYAIVADFASPIMLNNMISENTVGVNLQLSSSIVAGKNTIIGNKTDICSDKSLGENQTPLKLYFLWNIMQQLY